MTTRGVANEVLGRARVWHCNCLPFVHWGGHFHRSSMNWHTLSMQDRSPDRWTQVALSKCSSNYSTVCMTVSPILCTHILYCSYSIAVQVILLVAVGMIHSLVGDGWWFAMQGSSCCLDKKGSKLVHSYNYTCCLVYFMHLKINCTAHLKSAHCHDNQYKPTVNGGCFKLVTIYSH